MDKKLSGELDAIFTSGNAIAPEFRDSMLEIEDNEDAFVQAFYVQQAAVFLPAFAEIGEYVRRQQCDYRIDSQEDGAAPDGRRANAQVSLRFLIGATASHTQEYEYPHFKIMCDPAARKVIFHQSTIYPGHSGSSGTVGQARLEDVSSAMLQEKLVEFVRAVFAKI
jgi:hypothetical protein